MSLSKIRLLQELCEFSLTIEVNNHKDYFQSVSEYMSESDKMEDLNTTIYNNMVSTNTIVEIQAYPRTPNGFYKTFHYDLDKAIDEMIDILIKNKL